MKKFEHGELVFGSNGGSSHWQDPSGTKGRAPGVNPVEALNALGAEGWQVAAVSEGNAGLRYVLSRPVAE